jgi:hypothetical protein
LRATSIAELTSQKIEVSTFKKFAKPVLACAAYSFTNSSMSMVEIISRCAKLE